MTTRFVIGLTFALLTQPSIAAAEDAIDYSTDLIASYSDSSKNIRIGKKTASFRAGGAGFRFNAKHDRYGLVYGSLGVGYSPKETATLSGSTLSGPASSYFYGAGYQYHHRLNHRYRLSFVADYVDHDISSDVTGDVRGLPAVAIVTSDVSMFDTSVSLRYAFTRDVRITLGSGFRKWDIEALASGTVDDSIQVTSEALADGRNRLNYIGLEFKIKNIPVKAFYRHSQLKGEDTNSLIVHGLDFSIPFSSLFD